VVSPYRSFVRQLRRATAFVVILLLAQLTLVGSGFTCMPGAGPGDGKMASMPGMAGMDMAGMDTGGSQSQADHSHEPATPGSDSCNLPWAPNGCELMIPCSPHAIGTQGVANAAAAAPGHAELAWKLDTPPSAIIPPDPPPPRA
jgi:hypothetical protein